MQVLLVKGVEAKSNGFKNISAIPLVSFSLPLQNIELDIEQLFEFETEFRFFILLTCIRKVNLPHGSVQVDQVQFLQEPGWQSLFKFSGQALDQVGHQLADRLGSKVVVL